MPNLARTPVPDDADDHLSALDFGRIAKLIEGEAGIKLPSGKRLMVEGRLRKFYEENVLLEQKFAKDDKVTVGELVKRLAGKTGENVRVSRFGYFDVGAA